MEAYLDQSKKDYPDAQKKTEDDQQKVLTELKGDFATNEVHRLMSMEGVGYVMRIHSALWLFAQFMAHKGNIKEFVTHPFMLTAVAEHVAGKAMAEHGGKVGARWGGLSAVVDWIQGEEGTLTKPEAEAFNNLNDVYSHHREFNDYLSHGGAGHIFDLQKKRETENEDEAKPLTYKDILAYEEDLSGKNQGGLGNSLKNAQANESPNDPANTVKMDELIQKFVKSADTLQVYDQKTYNTKIGLVEKAQGIEPAAKTASSITA